MQPELASYFGKRIAMTKNEKQATIHETEEKPICPKYLHSPKVLRAGLYTTILGLFLLALGARPSLFMVDRSPVIGFVQTATFIVGLGLICIGGHLCLTSFWRKRQIPLIADFGLRIMSTGFVIAVFTGMADVFGFGSHPLPGVPFFGPLQSIGVIVGEAIIGIGLVMIFTPINKD